MDRTTITPRNALAGALTLLLVAGITTPGRAEAPQASFVVDEEVEQFALTGYGDDGARQWELHGRSADIQGEHINLTGINARSFTSNGELHLVAERGKLNRATQLIHLEEDVVLTGPDGTELRSPTLEWDANDDIVTSESHVELLKAGVLTLGRGLRGSPARGQYELQDNVRVQVEQGAVVITCQGSLEVNYVEGLATFHQDVVLEDAKSRVLADQLVAFFDATGNVVERVHATGNVEVIRGDSIAFCEAADYLPADGRVIMKGTPRLMLFASDMDRARVTE